MFAQRRPDDHSAYADLPVRLIAVEEGRDQVAVHLRGTLSQARRPLICIPAYQRNMSDFTPLLGLFYRVMPNDWPVLLVDLRGRGRSTDRRRKDDYATPADAADLRQVLAALAIPDAIVLGSGYGGQVAMTLAVEHPSLVSGAVLVDAGPLSNPKGLIRLKSNLETMQGQRGLDAMRTAMGHIAAVDYPGASEGEIESLALRGYYLDRRNRARGLFDPALIQRLDGYGGDDVLMAQWAYYDALARVPVMALRTQLTDLLRRDTFEEMARRRRDAQCFTIAGQASPALLNHGDEVNAIASFVRHASERAAKRRG